MFVSAARSVGLRIKVFNADSGTDFEAMFDAIVRHQVGAILIGNDPFIIGRRDQLVRLSARHAVPAIAAFREYTAAGGLISYGASIADVYRQAGTYVGRILKGVKPADLPVLQPTKFEFVVNARTAQVLGLTIPRKLLPLIDDVIE